MEDYKGCHFRQGISTPNVDLIISDLIKEWILKWYTPFYHRSQASEEIIISLKNFIENSTEKERLNIKIYIEKFNIHYSSFLDYWLSKLTLFLPKNEIDDINKIVLITNTIYFTINEILINSLPSSKQIFWFRDIVLVWEKLEKNYKSWKEISDFFGNMRLNFSQEEIEKLKKYDFSEIRQILEEFYEIKKNWWIINIKLHTNNFLERFIEKINIFKDIFKKDDFVKKFEDRKKIKIEKANNYWRYFKWISWIIIWTNLILITIYWWNELSFEQFIKQFFWYKIYIISFELILWFILFYFLWMFKLYNKIVEMYDSHILLIEADFFYKNDEQFQRISDETALFNMRKENTQKIHMLPEKMFAILNNQKIEEENNSKLVFELIDWVKKILWK